jgi:prevent-host-death family protein
MREPSLSEGIVPIGEFKAQASRLIRQLRDDGRPVVITQRGRAAAVIVLPEEYDRLREQVRFFEALREGLGDAAAGRVIEDSELAARLEAELGALSTE